MEKAKLPGQIVTKEVIRTLDGRTVRATVAWPETDFSRKLRLIEGTDREGLHIKVLARRVRVV